MLEVKDLVVKYGEIQALRGVSLQIDTGKIIAVV